MIFRRLGLLHKNQRGFTVLELLMVFAVTGLVAGGITAAIFQVFDGSARSGNHMTVIRQVQNAGYWVSRDTQMTQSVVITGVSGFPLTLAWTNWESGEEYQVVYTLLTDNKLLRSYSINGTSQGAICVAEFVDPDNTNCRFAAGSAFSLPDTGDEFTITDTVGGDSGIITVTAGSVTATPTGGATVAGGTDPVAIDSTSGTVAWTTPGAGDKVMIVADNMNTTGSWTATSGTATAAITVDDNGDATLAAGGVLVFRINATVGTGSLEQSETRVYEVIPRPST